MLLLLRSLWLVFKTLTGVFLWWRSSTSWYWGKIKKKKKNSQTEILQYFLSISQAMRVYLLTRLLWWTDVPWPKNSQHFDQCINTTLELSKLFTPLNTFLLLSSWKECAECLNGTKPYERLNWLIHYYTDLGCWLLPWVSSLDTRDQRHHHQQEGFTHTPIWH